MNGQAEGLDSARVALLFATSGHSGVDRIVANLLPEFGRTNYRFDLLTIGKHGPYPDDVPENVTVHRLPVSTKKLVLPPLAFYLWRTRPYALLTDNHHLNRAALMARQITGVETRITIRMGMSLSAKGNEMKPRRRNAFIASMRRWYPLANAAVAPSYGVGADLVQVAGIDPARLHVIGNPVVNDSFYRLAGKPLEHPWYCDSEYPVILSVGWLEPRKDFEMLLHAFAEVRRSRPCRLIILGEGQQRQKLQELVRKLEVTDDVDMPGYDENPYRHMHHADLFVLSSRREGSPVVLIEALACGTPVVSTDCPNGPAEILGGGRYGRLVPVGDVAAMASAIACSLDEQHNPARLKAAVKENRADFAASRYLQAMGLPVA